MKNSRLFTTYALVVTALVFQLGCATIINGPTQTVEITSDPAGARAVVLPSGVELVTPGKVDLERKIKEALPREVRYHYAGREIYVKDHELHVIYEVKELAA